MTVLVVNCGSSSVKFQLIDPDAIESGAISTPEMKRLIERIGTEIPDHTAALAQVANQVQAHLAKSGSKLTAIGHRVVHGGAEYSEPTLITDEVIETIDRLSVLAPLHNPANNDGIRAAGRSFPGLPQVAVFDTAFHATIPRAHRTYAVPETWERDYSVRRYGFHGTSHAFVSRKCAKWLEKERGIQPDSARIVVLHLGNGASACAVAGGKSVDTSMGLTPLPGLVMGTRSGDVDPAIFGHLSRVAGMSVEEVETALNRESGMAGLCGDRDMRAVEKRVAAGDERAELAMDVYVHRIQSTVGAYVATLGGIDAIAFTAGIGENSETVRARVAARLSGLGISIDENLNEGRGAGPSGVRDISADSSAAALLVIPTNEELEIATQTVQALSTHEPDERSTIKVRDR
ncbi:MAG: acetate kinase [Pseudomonadota bacterium]